MNVLITGAAGFIGNAVARKIIDRGDSVVGLDNLNPYYDPNLKRARLGLIDRSRFRFYEADITDYQALDRISSENSLEKIIHLAAQAGVRYSLEDPFTYDRSNNGGTLNILEIARKHGIKDVVFASSSSVYGGLESYPFTEDMDISCTLSLYAATKRSGELMCYTYNHLYGIRSRCLRFFTVYGPYGRPDMAMFKFTKNIMEEKPIDIYNNGEMHRDFTYIDDISDGVIAALDNDYDYEIFNLARGETIRLMDAVHILEKHIGKKAVLNMMGMQIGDVKKTSGDITKSRRMLGYDPKTGIDEGLKNYIDWYKGFYRI